MKKFLALLSLASLAPGAMASSWVDHVHNDIAPGAQDIARPQVLSLRFFNRDAGGSYLHARFPSTRLEDCSQREDYPNWSIRVKQGSSAAGTSFYGYGIDGNNRDYPILICNEGVADPVKTVRVIDTGKRIWGHVQGVKDVGTFHAPNSSLDCNSWKCYEFVTTDESRKTMHRYAVAAAWPYNVGFDAHVKLDQEGEFDLELNRFSANGGSTTAAVELTPPASAAH